MTWKFTIDGVMHILNGGPIYHGPEFIKLILGLVLVILDTIAIRVVDVPFGLSIVPIVFILTGVPVDI